MAGYQRLENLDFMPAKSQTTAKKRAVFACDQRHPVHCDAHPGSTNQKHLN